MPQLPLKTLRQIHQSRKISAWRRGVRWLEAEPLVVLSIAAFMVALVGMVLVIKCW